MGQRSYKGLVSLHSVYTVALLGLLVLQSMLAQVAHAQRHHRHHRRRHQVAQAQVTSTLSTQAATPTLATVPSASSDVPAQFAPGSGAPALTPLELAQQEYEGRSRFVYRLGVGGGVALLNKNGRSVAGSGMLAVDGSVGYRFANLNALNLIVSYHPSVTLADGLTISNHHVELGFNSVFRFSTFGGIGAGVAAVMVANATLVAPSFEVTLGGQMGWFTVAMLFEMQVLPNDAAIECLSLNLGVTNF